MESVEQMFRDYLKFKALADDTKARMDELKAELSRAVEEQGYEDDRGHQWYELEEQVGDFVSLQRQKRITKSLNEDTAYEILTNLGLRDKCVKKVEVLDEDAIMASLYDGTLTDEHIDAMFPSKVTWAFLPSKK